MNTSDFPPRKIALSLLLALALLTAAQGAVLIAIHLFGRENVLGIVPFLNMGSEVNLPTLFETLLFIVAAALLAVAAGGHSRGLGKGGAWAWYILSGVFILLAVDEFTSLHERLTDPVRSALGVSGPFFFAWFLPYLAGLLLLLLVYIPFLIRLPAVTRRLFIASGVIFLAGAVGMEMAGGNYVQGIVMGVPDLVYDIMTTVEEVLEMLGLTLFIYAVAGYIADELGGWSLNIPGETGES